MTTDLVYIIGGETSDDRADLRHSLRTVEANLHIDYRDVWIVGDVPAWFRGRALPLAPQPEKFANQRASLTAYANHPDAAERMVIMNDDMFLTEPVAELAICRCKNPLSAWTSAERETRKLNTWHRAVISTAEWVADGRDDPYIYECHTPLPFWTDELRERLAEYPADRPFAVGEMYSLAGAGDVGEHRGNAKCARTDSLADKLANPMPYLSCSPDTWTGVVGDYIRPRFTTPSRWEKPMLNAEMIKDQKQSPGLIENPCRDVLIDLASKVPADEAIVELGSYKGRSTAHLALGSSLGNGAPVHAFDPWEDGVLPEDYPGTATTPEYVDQATREAFEAHMAETGAREYVTAHQSTAVEGAASYDGPKVGLLFHDALHRDEDVFADLKSWLPHMAKDAVVVLHDTDDARYGVEAGAEKAFTRIKTLREKWNWEGRENHPWAKNQGRAPEDRRRGFLVVRTR